MKKYLILIAFIVVCFNAFPDSASAVWYSSSWTYRKSITIDNTKVAGSADHTSFPVLVDLTDAGLQANTQADGDDILFTSADGSTKLDHEIELYTTATGRLTAHVRIPTLDYDNDTTIYMYYGNGAASSQQNATGVWDSNYGGVWHMNDNAANTTVTESTSVGANGTNAANTDTKDVTGKVDGALTYNGTSDYVTTANNATLNASTGVTMSAWVKRNASGVFTRIVTKNSTSGNHFVYGNQFTSGNLPSFHIESDDTGVFYCNGATAVTNTTDYYYIVTTYTTSGSNAIIYLNGSADGSGQPGSGGCGGGSTYIGDLTSSTGALEIGSLRYEGVRYFGNAEIDEVRISNVVRSADWILTEYNNQSATSTFYTIGTQETDTPAAGADSYYLWFD